jgi:methyl-accepting chemotaxis protein
MPCFLESRSMRGIAISRLLMFAVFVPLAGLALFGGRMSYESWSRYSDLSRASSVLHLAVATARFCGIAIPAEGAATREVIGGTGNRATMEAARRVTDDYYAQVRAATAALAVHEPKLEAQLEALDRRMQAAIKMRAQVDANELKSPVASTTVLAPVAGQGIDVIGIASAIVTDAALSRRIFALYATLQFNEGTLIQRGTGEQSLREGKLAPTAFALFARGITLQAAFGKLFRDYAPSQVVEQFNAFDAANGRELDELRRIALSVPGTPATEAQHKRWLDINRDLTGVMSNVLNATATTVSAEGDDMVADARRGIFVYLGICLGVLLIVIALSRQVMRTLRDLLGELAGAMDKMRDGNYEVAIPHTGRADEIGVMARAVEGFRENFVRFSQSDSERKNAEALAERKSLLARLAGDFETVIGGIVGAVSSASGELTTAATTLSKTAETTQGLSTTVAAASDEASSNVQSVASSTEQMTASIGEIGRRVQESSEIAGEAVGQAQRTDQRIGKLAEAANRIGDVVKLITAIAEQTNLLALNATIEAARAGASGKGFAVVAQEVKQLAAQTAKATSEIGNQIAEMQSATQDSVAAIKEIGGTIGRISEIATKIASAVEEQGAATQEIARNVQQAAVGTTKVAGNISDVNAGAAKTGAASAEVLSAAQSLSQQSDRLETEVHKFLATVRAA